MLVFDIAPHCDFDIWADKTIVQIAIILNDRIRANDTVLNGTTTK